MADSIKDSLAVFRTSQGVEVRANLLRFTRHEVALEIYSSGTILQTSEVLSDFRILLNTGLGLVCEATLEDAWLDVDFTLVAGADGKLRGQFDEFLQEWQKLYRVRPEYKVVVADLQTFLTDVRLWLEQVELGIRSAPAGDR